METDKVYLKNKRRIWVAIMFSLIAPGLGQIYCGNLKRGLIFTSLSLLPFPILVWLFNFSIAPVISLLAIFIILAGGVIQLITILDSAYLARSTGADYQIKDCNSTIVYILFFLTVTGGSTGYRSYLKEKILEPFREPTASNYPSIMPSDRIFANKTVYTKSDPKKGDLVVFTNPRDRHGNYIKRVVAIAGDTVEIKGGQLYINNEKLQRKKLNKPILNNIRLENNTVLKGDVYEEINGNVKYKVFLATSIHERIKKMADFPKTKIPKHHCFVLGDNRYFSIDSRHFGSIPLATIKGRADYLYWAGKDWSRIGKIGK